MKINQHAKLSIAPMMDWTDRHCRMLHRQLNGDVLLYTEMVTSAALVRGGATHLLSFSASEHPVALQLGGSDPKELALAAVMGAQAGYAEINLNVGCPSDRVQSGSFGAVLMERPALVANCVAAMRASVDVPVTVKCRIGVDDQDPNEILPEFLSRIVAAGCERVTIHARKAWLKGLSPKENRDVPPLDYPLVMLMKQYFPNLHISINGGISSLKQVQDMLENGLDGVMIGRAAYHTPADILCNAGPLIFDRDESSSPEQATLNMLPYIQTHLNQGGKLGQVTRHMLGLFSGRPGARQWRRVLSEGAHRDGAGPELVEQALAHITQYEEARDVG